ncbi:MAG TPA: hypothetical protein VD907_02855 [Verrucomicrobiae bacterium]|nr:hypothetical protein [Verrucomicrobiae bacterium]
MPQAIKNWSTKTGDRTKLQHVYLALAGVLIIIAGLVSLLNPELGRLIVCLALGALAIFAINGIVWAVLYSLLYPQPSVQEKTSAKRK